MSTSVTGQSTSSEVSRDLVWYPTMVGPGSTSSAVITGRPEEIPFGPHSLVVEEPIPRRKRALLLEISSLGGLEENWDSYGARPIDPYCALTAAELIVNLPDSESPKPAVVPTTTGGIQFEWHRRGASLEIEVASRARVNVFFEDHHTGEEHQLVLRGDFTPLVPLLERLKG